MEKRQKVDERMFDHVKLLLKAGSTYKEAAEYLGLSSWTVGVIAHADSFDEYRNALVAMRAPKKPKEPKIITPEVQAQPIGDYKLPGGTLSANYQLNRAIQALEQMNKTLELLSNKVSFIVDELTK